MTNENIVEDGKASRFGTERNDPRKAAAKSKPYSIRNAMKRLADAEVSGDASAEQLTEDLLTFLGGRRIKAGELIALRQMVLAAGGDPKAVDKIIESVDGKLADKHEIKTSLPDLLTQSYGGDDDESPVSGG